MIGPLTRLVGTACQLFCPILSDRGTRAEAVIAPRHHGGYSLSGGGSKVVHVVKTSLADL